MKSMRGRQGKPYPIRGAVALTRCCELKAYGKGILGINHHGCVGCYAVLPRRWPARGEQSGI